MSSNKWRLRPFHVMIKPRGPICNLDCAYCYYLSKEKLYPGSDFRMNDEILESLTRQYVEAQPVPEVTFGWQGGEPLLMGLDFFRRAVDLQARYRRQNMRVINALQTNGTLLDDEWCRFFRQHGFLIGLSLDGPEAMHDTFRRDKGGAPTFERVRRGLALLQKHRVEYNVLATVHTANVAQPLKVYRFFRDQIGAQFVQFVPIVRRDTTSGQSVTGEQYGRFLISIFDEWVRRDIGRVFVQTFDMALGTWLGQHPGLCVFGPTCRLGLALEHNGDLYVCDHFVEPQHRLGNILESPLVDMANSAQQREFGRAKRDTLPPMCRLCAVRFACQGGCPKDRLLTAPNGEPGLNTLCAGYKAFFAHIDGPMKMMVEELHARHPPANVMFRLAKREAERPFT
jgi:uncharacterized protein